MNCPYCASKHIRKNGHHRGKQNYRRLKYKKYITKKLRKKQLNVVE